MQPSVCQKTDENLSNFRRKNMSEIVAVNSTMPLKTQLQADIEVFVRVCLING
jgi:transcriptional regulator